jgi:hypothetical protein
MELISTPVIVFMAWCLVKHRDNFTFIFTLQKEVNFEKRANRREPWDGGREFVVNLKSYQVMIQIVGWETAEMEKNRGEGGMEYEIYCTATLDSKFYVVLLYTGPHF